MEAIELDILDVVLDCSVPHLSAFLADTTDFGVVALSPLSSGSDEQPAPRRKRRHVDRPKAELLYLRAKHDELAAQLQVLQDESASMIPSNTSPWRSRAQDQAHLTQRCLQENARLKSQVADQLKVIEALEKVLHKRPNVSSFQTATNLWRQCILAATDREASLEQLLKHQYERLDSEWIRLGMYDNKNGGPLHKMFVQTIDERYVTLNYAGRMTRALDFRGMSDVFWDFKTGKRGASQQILQFFHPRLIYSREDMTLLDTSMPMMESRYALRRYDEADRVVIVWRSILEDQLMPHEPGNLIGNQIGWVVLEDKGPTECSFQIYATMATPMFPSSIPSKQPTTGTWTELLIASSQHTKEQLGKDLDDATEARRQQLAAQRIHTTS